MTRIIFLIKDQTLFKHPFHKPPPTHHKVLLDGHPRIHGGKGCGEIKEVVWLDEGFSKVGRFDMALVGVEGLEDELTNVKITIDELMLFMQVYTNAMVLERAFKR